jgi:RNA recognition motif-containing protein
MLQQDPRQQQQALYGYQHQQQQQQQQQLPMVQQGPFLNQMQQQQQQVADEPADTIPTAIVIKNIPFAVKRDALLAILDNLDIPKPYAFNYHFDNGVFRGLAFANYRTAEETEMVVNAVNGLDVSGRKLRVEFKKVMPAAEQEKREQDKAAAQAAEALHRRELELMEAQLLDQERREQEQREQERRQIELQNREFDRERRNRSSVMLERHNSGRSVDYDEADARYSPTGKCSAPFPLQLFELSLYF